MNFLLAVLLGAIAGFTAVLPVSGSAHASIFAGLFGFKGSAEDYLMMSVFIQLGVMAAMIVANRNLFKSFTGAFSLAVRGDGHQVSPRIKRFASLSGMALIPLILGMIFRKNIALLYKNYTFIGLAMIASGLVIVASTRYLDPGVQKEGRFSPVSALLTGLGQALGMLPGFSRTALVFAFTKARGGDEKFALQFSTVIAVPAIAGALIMNLIGTIGSAVNRSFIWLYLVGAVFAFFTALIAVTLLKRMLKNGSYIYLAYYSIPMGIVVILASLLFPG